MSDPLYRKDLLRLAADAHGAGRLSDADVSGHAYNPACGDRVTVDLRLDRDKILAAAFETNACVLAQASASILGNALGAATKRDIESLYENLLRMLDEKGPPPGPPYDAFGAFRGAVDYPARHRCVLLPLEAVLDALNKSAAP